MLYAMTSNNHQNDSDENLKHVIAKMEKKPLSEDDILLLACWEIASSYSFDEKDYK